MLFESEELRKEFTKRLYTHLNKLVSNNTLKTSEEFSEYYDDLFGSMKQLFISSGLTDVEYFKQYPDDWKTKCNSQLLKVEETWLTKKKRYKETAIKAISAYTVPSNVSSNMDENTAPVSG